MSEMQVKKSSVGESKEEFEIADSDILTRSELEHFLELLTQRKEEITSKLQERINSGDIVLDTNEMADEVDLASANVEQNVTFKLLDRDRKLLGEIKYAIHKVSTGDYGYCEGTGEAIPKKRLELTPWARYSVRYKEQLEKNKKARYQAKNRA